MDRKYTERTEFNAEFICAPQDYLKTLKNFKNTELEPGNWINDWVTRNHFRRDFSCNTCDVTTAFAEFQSDFPFDFFVNGIEFKSSKDSDGMHILPLTDIKHALTDGTNRLALRHFTNDNPLKAVGAIRGNLAINHADGKTDYIPTDSSWLNGTVCTFWAATEPQDWQISEIPKNYHPVNSFAMHPSLLRRSCYFKHSFTVNKSVKSAYLTATALGEYVPFINGIRVTDGRFLSGSMKEYTEYRVFDVTQLLTDRAQNTVGAYVGNGHKQCVSWGTLRYNIPAVMMQLDIEFTNGSVLSVCTDENWKVTASPLYDNDLQFGERYDARLEIENWCDGNCKSGVWHNAVKSKRSDIKPFKYADYPPVRAHTEVSAVKISEALQGEYKLYDFGKNSAARAIITLENTKPGEVIIIRYCELLDGDVPRTDVYGDVFFNKDNYAHALCPYGARDIDVYICKGAEREVYMPEFAYTGFRYVYIKGYSGEYTDKTVIKAELNTDLKQVGDFYSSDDGLNTIWDAVKRSYRSNIVTGPTDCPTREKNFWNGDILYFCATACWYTDNNALLSRWTEAGQKLEYNVYGWEDEEYVLPLTLYNYYGNTDVLKTKYPTIKKLIEKRLSQLNGNTLPCDHSPYNDHQAIKNVPTDFFAAAYYCRMWRDTAKIAKILGYNEDAALYENNFKISRDAFNKKFYLPNESTYSPKNQSSVVLPLAFGIADDKNIKELTATLHEYIASDNYKITCGFSSIEHILSLLCDNGYKTDAWKIITGTEFPSLLNMINTYGGGTTTEAWCSKDSIIDSMNHYAFGCIGRWFFEYVGGLKITSPAFKTVELSPVFYKQLENCRVNYNTQSGEISLDLTYIADDDLFLWKIEIPENTVASIVLPDGMSIYKNGAKQTDYVLKAGKYEFTVK